MNLPNLPRVLDRKEATFGLTFRKWWELHPISGTFELKHSAGKKSIPFSAIEPLQVSFAKAANSKKGVLARITVGTPGASDYIGLVNSPARSVRKSLTEERADAIATVSVRTRR